MQSRGRCLKDDFPVTSPFTVSLQLTGVPGFGIGVGHVVGPEGPLYQCVLLDVVVIDVSV